MSDNSSFAFVLFGATGDLAGKKIFPALFKLYQQQKIPADFVCIGNSRTEYTHKQFRSLVYTHVTNYLDSVDQAVWQHFSQRLFFQAGNAGDKETLDSIFMRLHELNQKGFECKNCIFHIATLPVLYKDILTHLGKQKKRFEKTHDCSWFRVLIEKPFGQDLQSSKQLNTQVHSYFKEKEIFRIDHFLGKETLQNILTIRIQPNEGIVLRFDAKKPGYEHQLQSETMQFCYSTSFNNQEKIDAYQRLIADAIKGDHTLFPTHKEVEAAWTVTQPLLTAKSTNKPVIYTAGSSGPKHADRLITKDGRAWIEPSPHVCAIPTTQT